MQVERSVPVMVKKIGVSAFELDAITPAQRDGEFTPLVILIERDQRVIQVKQGNLLFRSHSLSSMDLISGMVIARLVCRA